MARKSKSISRASERGGNVVGIDPGLSKSGRGALVSLKGGEIDEIMDMPDVVVGNSSYLIVDGIAVLSFLNRAAPDEIVIEMVGARPKQGVSSTFKFGFAYGAVLGVALASAYPVRLVTPTVWKTRAGLIGLPKRAALKRAAGLWPEHTSMFRRVTKDVGRADAGLIARFG